MLSRMLVGGLSFLIFFFFKLYSLLAGKTYIREKIFKYLLTKILLKNSLMHFYQNKAKRRYYMLEDKQSVVDKQFEWISSSTANKANVCN